MFDSRLAGVLNHAFAASRYIAHRSAHENVGRPRCRFYRMVADQAPAALSRVHQPRTRPSIGWGFAQPNVEVQEGFTEEQQQVLHGDGPQTEIEYRLAWARSYLKGMDLLVNSKRGVWA
jgi:hypothetical protein